MLCVRPSNALWWISAFLAVAESPGRSRGTTLFATGNNFTIVGDVCRRVIITNLDAQMERQNRAGSISIPSAGAG